MSKISQFLSRYKKDIEFDRNYTLELTKWAIKELNKGKIRCRLCPLCGKDNRQIIFKAPVYKFVLCENCGLIYAKYILDDETIEEFYQDNTIYQSLWEKQYENILKTKDRPTHTSIVNNILKFRNGNERCLDIGCSHGKLLYELKPFFKKVKGIELNVKTSKIGEELFEISIYNQKLEELDLPDNSYDVILLEQVIEHLNDLNSLFKEIYRILKPKGIVYIGCPNADSWSMKLFKERHIHIYGHGHINMFNKKSMSFFAKIYNFSIKMNNTSDKLDISLIDLIYCLFNENFIHRFNFNPIISPISSVLQQFLISPLEKAGFIHKLGGGGSYLEVVLEK